MNRSGVPTLQDLTRVITKLKCLTVLQGNLLARAFFLVILASKHPFHHKCVTDEEVIYGKQEFCANYSLFILRTLILSRLLSTPRLPLRHRKS